MRHWLRAWKIKHSTRIAFLRWFNIMQQTTRLSQQHAYMQNVINTMCPPDIDPEIFKEIKQQALFRFKSHTLPVYNGPKPHQRKEQL
ncbi:hypothetical protein KAR91_34310 [Candidatus Pacearchaeota archaeon]|nr:hypothetical protein [Candidatus Pacearchaeota archaeon]